MSEPSDKEPQNPFLDRWCNDEIAIEMPSGPSMPLKPLPEKVLLLLKAERALRARLDPKYRAHLESRGIFLTQEELQEPPSSENAKASPT